MKGSKRDGIGKMSYFVSEKEEFPEDVGAYEGQWRRDQR
jgi:hypothetical protein